jgi:hypothetical protein
VILACSLRTEPCGGIEGSTEQECARSLYGMYEQSLPIDWGFRSFDRAETTLWNILHRQCASLPDPSRLITDKTSFCWIHPIPDKIQGLELVSNLGCTSPLSRQTQCLRKYWMHGGLRQFNTAVPVPHSGLSSEFTIVQHTADLKLSCQLVDVVTSPTFHQNLSMMVVQRQ